jgi:uncharacterized protein
MEDKTPLEREYLPKLIFSRKIEIRKSDLNGYGVFATQNISKDEIIEQSPFIISGIRTKDLVQQNIRKFLWPLPCNCDECKYRGRPYTIASGFVQLYNHSTDSDVKLSYDTNKRIITITAIKDIKKNNEILVNYGPNYNRFEDF